MTRDQISANVIDNLGDSGVFCDLPEINDAVQDGYSDLVLTHGLLPKATTIDIVANRVYYDLPDLIPDFVSLRGLFLVPQKRWLNPSHLRYLQIQRSDWELSKGSSVDFWPVNYRRVALFPHYAVNITSGLYVFYYASAPTVALGNESINVPVGSGFRAIEAYATSCCLETAEEFTKASIYYQEYLEESKEAKNYRNSLILPDYIDTLKG